jgi:hypothetical protein
MTGKNLVKTGKVIKVDPEKILNLYKYAKYHITWESKEISKKWEEFRKYMGNRGYNEIRSLVGKNLTDALVIYIPANFVILPTYMRDRGFKLTEYYKDILEPKISPVVDINEFSLFDLYEVVEEPTGRLGLVDFAIGIRYRRDIGSFGVKTLSIIIEDRYAGPSSKYTLTGSTFLEGSYDEESTFLSLKAVKSVQGVSYSDLPSIIEHGQDILKNLKEGMLWLERDLTSTLNLIHFLHSHEFDENDAVGWLFKPYSDIIKGFGCNFEDALSLADVVSAFLL